MDEQVPAERPLDEAARTRRRAELLEAVARDGAVPATGARRWLVPAGVAAAVAAVVVAGAVVLGGGGSDRAEAPPGPADAGSSSVVPSTTTPSTTPTSSDPAGCSPVSGAPRSVGRAQRLMRQQMLGYKKMLPLVQAYRDVLAEHLDPNGQHLDAHATNVQSSGRACEPPAALGTKVGWTQPGEDGTGEVQVEVSSDWRSAQIHLAHDGWRPADVSLPGVDQAWSVKYDGGFAVAVQRTDGLTVALDAVELFGNNALTGISGFPFSPDDLFATAADPALTLP